MVLVRGEWCWQGGCLRLRAQGGVIYAQLVMYRKRLVISNVSSIQWLH